MEKLINFIYVLSWIWAIILTILLLVELFLGRRGLTLWKIVVWSISVAVIICKLKSWI